MEVKRSIEWIWYISYLYCAVYIKNKSFIYKNPIQYGTFEKVKVFQSADNKDDLLYLSILVRKWWCRLCVCVHLRHSRQRGDPRNTNQHSPCPPHHHHRGASPDKDRTRHSQPVYTPHCTHTGRITRPHGSQWKQSLFITFHWKQDYDYDITSWCPSPSRFQLYQPTCPLREGSFLWRCLLWVTVGPQRLNRGTTSSWLREDSAT